MLVGLMAIGQQLLVQLGSFFLESANKLRVQFLQAIRRKFTSKDIIYRKAKKIKISSRGLKFHTDAEIAGNTPIEISVLPGYIRMIRG